MPEQTCWESIKSESEAVVERLKRLVREGNIRSIRVRQGARVVAVFPLVSYVLTPVAAEDRRRHQAEQRERVSVPPARP